MLGPFIPPRIVLDGFKERIEALTVQGDRLYAGTSTGNLHVYSVTDSPDSGQAAALLETRALTKKPIEQLGFLKDINSLVVLSESLVTLYPLPDLKPPSPLTRAKAAFSFALHTSVQHLSTDGQPTGPTMPTVVSYLVVGCRRKVVIYSWKDGEPQEVQEAPLPHSPRVMSFLNSDTICFAYAPEHALFSISSLVATDLVFPASAAGPATAMGAFTGFTGYMTLGLGAKAKPCVVSLNESEVLVARDNIGHIVNADGSITRNKRLEWPAPPEDVALIKPYVFAIMPPGSVPTQGDGAVPSFFQSSTIQIRSAISLAPAQSLNFPTATPPSVSSATAATPNYTVRLLTPSPSSKSPLYLVRTPMDRATATAQGSAIWKVFMKPWGEQVDELVNDGAYSDALALLEITDSAVLPDKDQRTTQIRALHAVSLFRLGKFDEAIDIFIELNTNPAKVVSLYDETIAGRFSTPRDEWIPLFGGPKNKAEESHSGSSSVKEAGPEEAGVVPEGLPASTTRDSLRGIWTGFGVTRVARDDDTVSVSSRRRERPPDDYRRSVETLLRYLSDRRPKVDAALTTFHITASQSHKLPPLSEASVEDLRSIPDAPLSALTPEQLLRFAQIVYTALFKSYLVIRPGLLGSLCRVPNYCEVSEVEEELRAREKFSDLIDLYNGKKMHAQALGLLQQLSEHEDDMRDKLQPSVSYLQRLGPEYLDQIFLSSRWVFEQDADIGFEIFTSEEVELPRSLVADFLESIDPKICSRFIEYLINERGEESPEFHDRLAELYLKMTLSAKRQGKEDSRNEFYAKLLEFIDTTSHYRTDRLFGQLPSDGLFEAKAMLLGRLGRHENALEIYVYRLQDYLKAEEYCKRVYEPKSSTANIFLNLLQIYLQPIPSLSSPRSPTAPMKPTASALLQPALELISRHSPRLDPIETLQYLPPLVQAQNVKEFLVEALRAPRLDVRIIREISKTRKDQVATRLMMLEEKRVQVTDSRICPHCHKRIGNSVIAVHAPVGEVTHYQCREAFSKKLLETRR